MLNKTLPPLKKLVACMSEAKQTITIEERTIFFAKLGYLQGRYKVRIENAPANEKQSFCEILTFLNNLQKEMA